MPILSREDYMNNINTLAGDRNDDETLSIIEAMSTHYNELFNRTQSATELEQRIAQLEEENRTLENTWRDKYKNAFMSGNEPDNNFHGLGDNRFRNNDITNNPKSFDELFK